MDKSSTYPHFHISTATICRFVRTYITIFTNKIAQFQHMGEFTPQQLTKSRFCLITLNIKKNRINACFFSIYAVLCNGRSDRT